MQRDSNFRRNSRQIPLLEHKTANTIHPAQLISKPLHEKITIHKCLGKWLKTFMEEPKSNSYLFVCNPQADVIAESSPNVFKLKGVENLTEISIALTSAIHKLDAYRKGPRRACVEIVSDALLQHHAVQTRKWLTALTTELASAGFTILAVMDPRMHPPEELYSILGLFDGEINIYEKGVEHFLRIKRMSNQKYLKDELLLKEEDMQK